MADNDPWMADWLALADEAVRRHRQGRILDTDPALVLRGIPAIWSRATDDRDPAHDLVALAGAALDHVDLADPLRPLLVEAAAGCLGRDLPALLRHVRSTLDAAGADLLDPPTGARVTAPGRDPSETPPADVDGSGRDGAGHQPGRPASGRGEPDDEHGPGRRLAGLGAAALVGLAVLGLLTEQGPGTRPGGIALTSDPIPVPGRASTLVAWDPPHLAVEVGSTRYRYRLEGDIDRVVLPSSEDAVRTGILVVERGDERWEVEVPALDRTPDATDPAPDHR